MTSHSGPRFPLVQLATHHDVSDFACGRRQGAQEIEEYLKVSALAEQTAGLSQVWVAIDSQVSAQPRIAGYITLSPLSVPISPAVLDLTGLESVPYRSVGGYLLGRLGVAAHLQGEGLGGALVLPRSSSRGKARNDAGGAFLAVDPKNDGLLRWYERLDFGFRRLDPNNVTKRQLVLRL